MKASRRAALTPEFTAPAPKYKSLQVAFEGKEDVFRAGVLL